MDDIDAAIKSLKEQQAQAVLLRPDTFATGAGN